MTATLDTPIDPPAATSGRIGSFIRSTVLNIAAAGGALCIVAVICAIFFDISLIMFKTGSMSPTIPAGSLAVVREIPADEVEVGDVVTVDRPGKLPVTHRVVAIEPGGGGVRNLTLKGDANPVEDLNPYPVDRVRIVMWSVPGLAKAVVAVSNRWVMLGTTLAVSALVTWVFWPRPEPVKVRARHRKSP